MSIPRCTICGKDIDIEKDNNVDGYCDDGAELYAHMSCASKEFTYEFDYKTEAIRNLITYTKPVVYN